LATAVVVTFATPFLDVGWIPDDAPIVVVHNDDQLDRSGLTRAEILHLEPGNNIGFGAAVNLALEHVTTARIVLCNPDVSLTTDHWKALVDAEPDEVVTVPLVDAMGQLTSVVSRYPTPISHLASAYRLGRFAPRGGHVRRVATQTLGAWGRAHRESLATPVGTWPLSERWVSGGVLSVDTARLRAVGGFDPNYFLYYEDVDVCERLADAFPDTRAVVADVAAGDHQVGGSALGHPERTRVERDRRASAARYARSRSGAGWSACATLLRPRVGRSA